MCVLSFDNSMCSVVRYADIHIRRIGREIHIWTLDVLGVYVSSAANTRIDILRTPRSILFFVVVVWVSSAKGSSGFDCVSSTLLSLLDPHKTIVLPFHYILYRRVKDRTSLGFEGKQKKDDGKAIIGRRALPFIFSQSHPTGRLQRHFCIFFKKRNRLCWKGRRKRQELVPRQKKTNKTRKTRSS